MLTLTPTASAAVHALLDNPELPDSSGVRLQSQTDAAGTPGIGIEVVSAPIDGDQLVHAGAGHDVFLSPDVAPVLDDQVLDAELDERRVAFSLRPQDLDGAS
jgi:Fe-S cluster assembly iron-binding protein IscA